MLWNLQRIPKFRAETPALNFHFFLVQSFPIKLFYLSESVFFFPLGNCILAVFQWSHLPENGLKNKWPSNTKFLSQYEHYSAVQKWQRSQISWWKLAVNALPGSNTVNLQAWQISCTHWHFQMLMRNAVLESTRLSFKKLMCFMVLILRAQLMWLSTSWVPKKKIGKSPQQPAPKDPAWIRAEF